MAERTAPPELRTLVTLLGGASSLGLSGRRIDRRALRARIVRGLPARALEALADVLGTSTTAMSEALQIPARTLTRRLRSKSPLLTRTESDRLVRLARLVAQAQGVLGTRVKAVRWLQSANLSLDNERPFDLLDSDPGTEEVEAVLTRLEHGVVG